MEDLAERRSGHRVGLTSNVTIELAGKRVHASSLDVGVGGMAVWAPLERPSGTLRVCFHLDPNEPCEVQGTVVRQFESDGGAVWGIRFEEIDPITECKLSAFVERQS